MSGPSSLKLKRKATDKAPDLLLWDPQESPAEPERKRKRRWQYVRQNSQEDGKSQAPTQQQSQQPQVGSREDVQMRRLYHIHRGDGETGANAMFVIGAVDKVVC